MSNITPPTPSHVGEFNSIWRTWLDALREQVVSFQSNKVLDAEGISFPATQISSSGVNTLDDYEEGTCTVALTCGSGTATLNSSTNTLRYTKIGNTVTITGQVGMTSVSSPSGSLRITGLPFVNYTSALGKEANAACTVFLDALATAPTSIIPFGVILSGTSEIALYDAGTTGYSDDLSAHIGVSTQFTINTTYLVAS